MDDTRTGLPASIEVAWGLRDRPLKGPKPGLSLARIVDAAVRVASAEGLAAVSMSRVANELGAATMSLYRYVAAKDELLALMWDAAIGKPLAGFAEGLGWRAGLAKFAWAYLEILRQHRWLVRMPISGPLVTPNQILWFEQGLRALRDTGLAGEEKVLIIMLVSGYVRSEATLAADLSEAFQASSGLSEPALPSYGRLLATLTDPESYPALHEVIATGALDNEPSEDDDVVGFAFGLERVLDGIEVLVRQRATGQ